MTEVQVDAWSAADSRTVFKASQYINFNCEGCDFKRGPFNARTCARQTPEEIITIFESPVRTIQKDGFAIARRSRRCEVARIGGVDGALTPRAQAQFGGEATRAIFTPHQSGTTQK